MPMATAVTLRVPDGSGGFAAINITDIVTNKATASWKCARVKRLRPRLCLGWQP